MEYPSLYGTLFTEMESVTENKKNNPDVFISNTIGKAKLVHGDSLLWLETIAPGSIHAIVTDPPYGVVEYDYDQLEKRKAGKGGVWRLPPAFDGHIRAPLPRFTALNENDRLRIYNFFVRFARAADRALLPGGHIIIATNSFIAPLLYRALEDGGLEFRGQIMRTVRTLRGGDRPKNAEKEFSDVSSLPRGCYEPWGIFRKKLPVGMRVHEALRTYGTGGLRRISGEKPFEDLVLSERTPRLERDIANHPSIKPQSFMRKVVYAALPLGKGVVADPFMGSGSTIAAAEYVGYESVGVEINKEYFDMATKAIPKLANIRLD